MLSYTDAQRYAMVLRYYHSYVNQICLQEALLPGLVKGAHRHKRISPEIIALTSSILLVGLTLMTTTTSLAQEEKDCSRKWGRTRKQQVMVMSWIHSDLALCFDTSMASF